MLSDAVLSPCERYRYTLRRVWDADAPLMVFIMLNPSTADAAVDDATIRRCMGFARDNGFGGILVLNLFAFRATKPAEMKATADPVGLENDAHIMDAMAALRPQDRVVAAWGVHGRLNGRADDVVDQLESLGVIVLCLGRTKDGHPKHPLYLAASSPLIPLQLNPETA